MLLLTHRFVQITKVSYPSNFAGKALKMAYIEFGDEDAMKAGFSKHAEVCLYLVLTYWWLDD